MKRHSILAVAILMSLLFTGVVFAEDTKKATPIPTPKVEETKEKININVATAEELVELPGIGKVIAARIVEYREKNGSYKTPEDMMNVKGIGEKTFEKIKDLIVIAAAQKEDGQKDDGKKEDDKKEDDKKEDDKKEDKPVPTPKPKK